LGREHAPNCLFPADLGLFGRPSAPRRQWHGLCLMNPTTI
jgi:hypothetical protein